LLPAKRDKQEDIKGIRLFAMLQADVLSMLQIDGWMADSRIGA
jgi:hypothetical protein